MTFARIEDCKSSHDKGQFVNNALKENMWQFMAGFIEATNTKTEDWSIDYRTDALTGLVWSLTISHAVTGAAFFIRADTYKGRFSVSASLPRFAYGHYTLSDLCPKGTEVPTPPTFAINRLVSNPRNVGKAAGKRYGLAVIALWPNVTKQIESEQAITNGRENAIKHLEALGWRVRKAYSGSAYYATKEGCKELTISDTGRVSFYYPHFSASVEAMAQAAAILGE